ncbi:MAG: inositol phosphorylceramide synthase [Candidatus Riflebacteria bacterium]|nr:inositol phosphorylceramide synthase [Candidatus Riflebacteria bacterium]
MFWFRIFISALLSVMFLVVYGGCNWYTSLRTGVGSFFFEWERTIPFLPWTILPYMSIDLFFVLAPFACRTRAQVVLFARRVAVSIGAAGAFFLIWPLKFSFERPHADGIMGAVFDWFRTLDQPFNQFPSLHITLSVILIDVYARRFSGPGRVMILGWFTLVMLSTVTTFQHHIIDVIGGAILATVIFALFRRPASVVGEDADGVAGASPERGLEGAVSGGL